MKSALLLHFGMKGALLGGSTWSVGALLSALLCPPHSLGDLGHWVTWGGGLLFNCCCLPLRIRAGQW